MALDIDCYKVGTQKPTISGTHNPFLVFGDVEGLSVGHKYSHGWVKISLNPVYLYNPLRDPVEVIMTGL